MYLPRYDDSLSAVLSRTRLRWASKSDTTGAASAWTTNQSVISAYLLARNTQLPAGDRVRPESIR